MPAPSITPGTLGDNQAIAVKRSSLPHNDFYCSHDPSHLSIHRRSSFIIIQYPHLDSYITTDRRFLHPQGGLLYKKLSLSAFGARKHKPFTVKGISFY